MIWIIIVAVIIFTIYLITKDHKEDLQTNVINQGGMMKKYSVLMNYLTQHPSSTIAKVTSNHIAVTSPSIDVLIDYVGGQTEIKLFLRFPQMGTLSNKWTFGCNYTQTQIINVMESYVDKQMQNYRSKFE